MNCKKCGQLLDDSMAYCFRCGTKQDSYVRSKKRGNGTGSVYKLQNGKYKAVVSKYYVDDGKLRRKTRSGIFEKKKDALAALAELSNFKAAPKKAAVTFKGLYDLWLPTHRAGQDTLNCYKAAVKYFADLWPVPVADIDVDDLQECIDDCPRGKRTKENMRALISLMYKYGIPRRMIPDNLNLSPFLAVSGEAAAHRESFNDIQIQMIKNAVGVVPYANYIYCMIYLGFRPSEFLALQIGRYDPAECCFVGGAKTAAGIDRPVTVSPKILPLIEEIIGARTSGPVFAAPDGNCFALKHFTEECFYPALEQIGIENPMVTVGGGVPRHKYTPHSCRHTFATLMKRIDAADKDKLALIGHTSDEMLRYYQDVNLDDLRKITNAI